MTVNRSAASSRRAVEHGATGQAVETVMWGAVTGDTPSGIHRMLERTTWLNLALGAKAGCPCLGSIFQETTFDSTDVQ